MINVLTMINFRGINDEYELTGCDLFTGLNGSGKTAVLNAIEYALTGQIQGVNTAESLHSKFGTGDKMTVSLSTDAFNIVRSTIRKESIKKGEIDISFKSDIFIKTENGSKITAIRECEAWLKQNVNIPTLAFNFNEFLKMKDSEQREFIQSLITSIDMTFSDFMNRLKEKTYSNKLEDSYKSKIEEAYSHLATKASNCIGEALLNIMYDEADVKFKEYNKQKKQDSAGASKFTEMKNDLDGNVKKIGRLEKTISKNRSELEDQTAVLIKSQETYKQKIANDEKLTELQTRLANAQEYDFKAKLSEFNAKCDELKKCLKTEFKADLRLSEIEALKDQSVDLKGDLIKLENEKEIIVQKVKHLSKELHNYNSTLNNIQGEFKCPLTQEFCNADMNSIKIALTKLVDDHKVQIIEFEKQIVSLDQSILEIKRSKADVLEQIESVKLDVDDKKDQLKEIQEHNQAINDNLEILNNKIVKINEAQSNNQTLITELQNQINECNGKTFVYEDVEELESIIEGIKETIDTDVETVDQLKKKQQLLQNQMKAIKDAQESETYFNVWSDIKKAIGLKGIKGDVIKESMNDITTSVNINLSVLGRIEKIFFDFETERGKEIFEFGLSRSGEKINFDSLCGAEKMNLATAMIVMFMNKLDTKLKILTVDEVNILFDQDRQSYIEGLSLLSQQLDNVIVNGAIDPDELNVYEFEVIEL